jgi:asparagine synthase (glutamine-hydrolysing)
MFRYVAFLRNARSTHTGSATQELADRFRQTHPKWQLLNGIKGISIFYAPPAGRCASATILPMGRGVILGTLFPKDLRVSPRDWNPVIDEKFADEIVQTEGRQLVNHFWGRYVAFLASPDGASHYVLRDCSGMIPCYTIAQVEGTIATANIEDLDGLSLGRFFLNPQYLAGFIYEAELSQSDCALNEVKELLAGECLDLTNGAATRSFLWDPREICRERALEDFEVAAVQISAVTQACVDYWASKYDRIVHHLSGGLDSSAILGCLKRSPYCPAVTCVHLESTGAGESERKFAQLAADAAGMELVLQPGFSADSRYDERIFRLPRSPKPSVAHVATAIEGDTKSLAYAQTGVEAIWDGQGGDHLFFESNSPIGAVDYAFRHGIAGAFSEQIRDAARLSRMSYWGVMRKAIRLGLLRLAWQPEDEYQRQPTFLNPEFVRANLVSYVWQPWSDCAADLPPGKRWQISLLGSLIHRHRPLPELRPTAELHPFFSQPLFELCLQVPTYTLLRGGANRALERAAFHDCVPQSIIHRQGKGTTSTSFMRKIRESLPFIRDLILGGVLAHERIIERAALEPYLAANRPLNQNILWPFLSCLTAEIWARKWAASGWRL